MFCYLLLLKFWIFKFILVESFFFALDDFYLLVVRRLRHIMQWVHHRELPPRDLRYFQYLVKCYLIFIDLVESIIAH